MLESKSDIQLYVAPKGLRDFIYNPSKMKEDYLREGWKITKIGIPSLKTHATNYTTKGECRQYGLKHFVTSTLHVLQGLTINKIATEINMFSSEYNL